MIHDENIASWFLPLNDAQVRQYIDAETVHREFLLARSKAGEVRGGMLWRTVDHKRYLIRTSARGSQKSLGAETPALQDIYERFIAKKERAESRLKSLKEQLDVMQRLNRALRVGRVPGIVVDTLNALDTAGIASDFLTLGTHALYAYEAAAGLRMKAEFLATMDIDLFVDVDRHLQLIDAMRTARTSLLGILRKADKSFQVRGDQKQTAVNDKGFEVDFIRRPPKDGDPHPMPLRVDEDPEDTLWALQVPSGDRIQNGGMFTQMVVSPTGAMASMTTIDPHSFVRIKRTLSESQIRDPLKARKDGNQAELVARLLSDAYLVPQWVSPPAHPSTDGAPTS